MDLMPQPPETLLPEDPTAALLAAGESATNATYAHPDSPLAWASLAQEALDTGAAELTVYAYARVGYHRGLDLLRRNGWKGNGPVPWEHEPNRGFLTALALLSKAAASIGETVEADRCALFLQDSSQAAYDALLG